MFHFPHRIRFVRAAALLVALAAALAPAAQAAEKPDAEHQYLGSTAPLDVRSPDREFPAHGVGYPSGAVFAANAAARDDPRGLPRAMPSDYAAAGVDPATMGETATESRFGGIPRAMPSDYAVYFAKLPAPAADGFDWGDATFGGGMTAAALLLAGAIAVAVRQRRRVALP